ncbi:hypothetical protein Nhal_0979 [Nitrosococcus halophilus Nc 4]|uniref:Uncharacterized protein n=1 Tax=Nitrosococcus halophilus (strain Nc4) TaxID=472759 RepID=D5BYG9_NITHN|nr:hypothetical protein Nhal_0979 [Nitrosococcus halophilus Nc 4]
MKLYNKVVGIVGFAAGTVAGFFDGNIQHNQKLIKSSRNSGALRARAREKRKISSGINRYKFLPRVRPLYSHYSYYCIDF